jgi:hypothetical protein
MNSSNDPRLLETLVVSAHALAMSRKVKDNNNDERTDEREWLKAAREQDDEISASEVEFFEELRKQG